MTATLAAAMTACGDPSGPGAIAGAFTLRTIDGQQLPVLVSERQVTDPSSGNIFTRRDYVDAMRLAIVAGSVADTVLIVQRSTFTSATGAEVPMSQLTVSSTAFPMVDNALCFGDRSFDDPSLPCSSETRLRRRGDGLVVLLAPGPYPTVGRVEYVFGREGR